MLTSLPPRRSRAALSSAAQSETTRTILTALALNLLVAAAKLGAGLLTGSAALLAEAGHSLADSVNEVLLGISVRRSRVPADLAHPLGHGRERFLWALLAAIASFLIGLLLAVTAFGLARPLADYLVGRSMPPGQLRRLEAIVSSAPAVEQLLALQAVYTGPQEVIVAAKVRPVPSLTIDGLTRAMDELDAALRAAVPEVAEVYIDVTAYRSELAPTGSSTRRAT